jgi:spore coat protein U-like protein
MKPNKKLIAAAFAVFAMSSAQAADNHTITVNAVVSGTCKFISGASSIDMTLDPTLSTNLTGTSNIQYRCTKGTVPSFVYASGSTGAAGSGELRKNGEMIPYSFAAVPGGNGQGMAPGLERTLAVTVTVNQADAANVTPETYTDTVAITLTP